MEIVIVFAVVEIGLQAMANLEAAVVGNRYIAEVKEPMDVCAQ